MKWTRGAVLVLVFVDLRHISPVNLSTPLPQQPSDPPNVKFLNAVKTPEITAYELEVKPGRLFQTAPGSSRRDSHIMLDAVLEENENPCISCLRVRIHIHYTCRYENELSQFSG